MRMRKALVITLLFFLTGILFNPALAWHIERPRRSSDEKYQLPSHVENMETDNIASVGLGVNPNSYVEKFGDYGYSDFISLNVSMTAILKRVHHGGLTMILTKGTRGLLENTMIMVSELT